MLCELKRTVSMRTVSMRRLFLEPNRLNETQNICLKLWVRKYLQFYAEKKKDYLNLCIYYQLVMMRNLVLHFIHMHNLLTGICT